MLNHYVNMEFYTILDYQFTRMLLLLPSFPVVLIKYVRENVGRDLPWFLPKVFGRKGRGVCWAVENVDSIVWVPEQSGQVSGIAGSIDYPDPSLFHMISQDLQIIGAQKRLG
jgi:hypothetical protein